MMDLAGRDEHSSADVVPELERQRLRSLVEVDIDVMRRLHSPDYELITPGGQRLDGVAYLGAIQRGSLVYDTFEPASEIRMRTDGQAAILRYQARIEVHGRDWRDAGVFWHTDFYEFRDGRWQAVWSHATQIEADRTS